MTVLRNGTEEAEPIIAVTMTSLQHLGPIELYELVKLCRDPSHKLYPGIKEKLQGLALIQPDGHPHDSIRNIVLSAAVGDGLDLHLESPVRKS